MKAEQLIDATFRAMLESPPSGVTRAQVESFAKRRRLQLIAVTNTVLHPLGGDRIVTLNLGLGRDSFAMLCYLLEGNLIAQSTRVRIQDVSVVVFSDTGFEWAHTYYTLPLAKALCEQVGLRFLTLQKPPREGDSGWESWQATWESRHNTPEARTVPPWRRGEQPSEIEARAASGYYHLRAPILNDYNMRSSVISVNKQDCTANHKIAPMRKALEDLARERFGVETNREWGAAVRKGQRRPHLAMIGYAADETHRLGHEGGLSYVVEAYPLVEMGIRKVDEEIVLKRWNLNHVRKSGCSICPYQPVGWYWALRETDPEGWKLTVQYEADALRRNPRMNLLPGRGATIEQAVDKWRLENPDATVDGVLNKEYTRCDRPRKTAMPEQIEALEDTCPVPSRSQTQLHATIQARVLLNRNLGGMAR